MCKVERLFGYFESCGNSAFFPGGFVLDALLEGCTGAAAPSTSHLITCLFRKSKGVGCISRALILARVLYKRKWKESENGIMSKVR